VGAMVVFVHRVVVVVMMLGWREAWGCRLGQRVVALALVDGEEHLALHDLDSVVQLRGHLVLGGVEGCGKVA
jgi:hypothetical protein